ncbi:MAG: 3',5'-cyclic-AMP phosphodiesterase [Pseudomonadota bacterium]|nr:3',5'-cyclic-AMP phosphodiesterase [Pseudomonadota bacterium]
MVNTHAPFTPPLTDHAPLQVIQLSDPHLFGELDARLLGMNTQHSLEQTLALIQQQHPQIDFVLATGDIAQAPIEAIYGRFHRMLSQLNAPQCWLQGNHDLDQLFLAGSQPLQCSSPTVVVLGNWRIVMLNSSQDHQVAGMFTCQELDWLKQALESTRGFYTIVALHHHPIAVGSRWLDAHMLSDSFPFWRLIEQYPQVSTVIHGHVHQSFEGRRGNIQIYACPSTCIQFKPLSREFALDQIAPGYRWFKLYADGQLQTGVNRLTQIPEGVDFQSLGY